MKVTPNIANGSWKKFIPIHIPVVAVGNKSWTTQKPIKICLYPVAHLLVPTKEEAELTEAQKANNEAKTAKENLIKQRFSILIHGMMCRAKDELFHDLGLPKIQCTVPDCNKIKVLLFHMKTCHDGKQCPHPNCHSSHQIIEHWSLCLGYKCTYCSSLRKAVSEDVFNFFEWAKWNNEALQKFNWLFKFGGLPHSQFSIAMDIKRNQRRHQLLDQRKRQQDAKTLATKISFDAKEELKSNARESEETNKVVAQETRTED